ncbi:MAG TPA: hypothetical protein VEK79_23390 [Thermoanaerobaculia bacterium]|nr:hypothetical protein [Thermoanaerobaculia bacterium]
MGDKAVKVGLKVTDNKVSFTVSHLKLRVEENAQVTITWELEADPGLSWFMNPAGIVFEPRWPGPTPSFDNNRYSVSYTNTTALRGSFKYSINVQLAGADDFNETLVFDPEVQNEPPNDEPEEE